MTVSFGVYSRWVHPKYTWSKSDVGSSKSTFFIFHMGPIFCFLPAILMSSTYTDRFHPRFRWTRTLHSQFGTFSHPSSNKASSNCLSQNNSVNGWPNKFRSRSTTGSSMLSHELVVNIWSKWSFTAVFTCRSFGFLFRAVSWSYKANTVWRWAEFCNFDLYNPSRIISEGISLTDKSAWPIWRWSLGRRHLVNLQRTILRVLVLLHWLWSHENTHTWCTQLVFLVRIGRVLERAALRLTLFQKCVCALRSLFHADAIIASSISKSGNSCPTIDRDVMSSSVAPSSLIQSTVIWGSAVLRQSSILKLTYQLWNSTEFR